MVITKESQMPRQLSDLKPHDLNQTALVQLEKNHRSSYFNSSTLTADVAFQGKPNSNLRVGECFKLPPPYWNIPHPTEIPYLKNSQIAPPHGLLVSDEPIDASCAPQDKKKFLIFDRSGNHTRLFFGPSYFSPQNQVINQVIASATPVSTQKVESRLLLNPVAEEKWADNDLNDGEDEMLENTEEIDALLDSDSSDDDDQDSDEVTSTRHIPFRIEEGSSPKRQRLLDGGYKKSSCVNEDDHESSYVGDGKFYDGIESSKRGKKVKIHETLRILESIIPGSKSSKDPVSIIEKAIVYLQSVRIEAEALGLGYAESKSVTYR